MTHASRATLPCTLLLALAMTGCAAPHMKPPPASAAARPWAVSGPTTSKYSRARELHVGAFVASAVHGTPIAMPGMSAYGRIAEQRDWKFEYELTGGPTALHAQCEEAVDHAIFYGLGGQALNLYCTCSEGGTPRARISFDGEKGRVVVQSRGYQISAAHDTAQGESTRAMLGYRLSAEGGEGAVDIGAERLVFVPRDLEPGAESAFACISAALLLHRPLQ